MTDWTVRATIGSDVYTQALDPDADPVLPQLLAVQWVNELEDADGWPRPQALTTATVQLLVEDASAVADISPATPVFLEFIVPDVLEDNLVTSSTPPVALGSSTVTSGILTAGHTWWRVAVATPGHGARVNLDLAELVDGAEYEASWLIHNHTGSAKTVRVDWTDWTYTEATLAPGETRRVSVRAARPDYTTTFRFTDMAVQTGGEVLVRDIRVRRVQPAAVVDSFAGRASFPVVEPRDTGSLVTLSVASYLMDLDAEVTGNDAWPSEFANARLERVMGWDISPGPVWLTLAARDISAVSVLEYVRAVLSYSLLDTAPLHLPDWSSAEMFELVAQVDANGVLDPADPWWIAEIDPDVISPMPLTLRENPDDPGTYELWADPDNPDTTEAVVDADLVLMDAKWSRVVDRAIDTVHVQITDQSVVTATSNDGSQPAVAYTLETDLANATMGEILAEWLLPSSDTPVPSQWEAEEFEVQLNHTPDGWYPRGLREVMALGNLQRRHHPEGLVYWVGVITSRALAVSQGVATVTLQLEAHPITADQVAGLNIDGVPHDIDSISATIDSFANAR